MFLLGTLAIQQIFIFPGLILTKGIGFKSRFITNLIAVISSSLVINYLLVLLLTALHLFTQAIIFTVICIEVIIILRQNKNYLKISLDSLFNKIRESFNNFIANWIRPFTNNSEKSSFLYFTRIIYICFCLILAYVSLKWIAKLFFWNLGSVFNSYDTIMSWNQWAIDWSSNSFPQNTKHYPQLLPANWAIIYTLIGSQSIQFFAQAIMPLFTLFIIIMIIDLGFAKRNPGFFIGCFITYLTLKKFLGSFVIEGLADTTCAFFAFSAIYFLFILLNDPRSLPNKAKYGIFITIVIAGCAVTKQVGLLFTILFSIVFILFYFKPLHKVDKQIFKKSLTTCLIVLCIIIIPWYLYMQIMIWKGLENSEINEILNATQGAQGVFNFTGVQARFITTIESLGKYFYLLVLIIPLSFLVESLLRHINFLILIPLFLSWALFASYDFRNLALALPILGISGGLSIHALIEKIFTLLKKIQFNKINTFLVFFIFLFLIGIVGQIMYPNQYLLSKQQDKTMSTFSPTINTKIVSLIKDEGEEIVFVTNYPIKGLPGAEDKSIISLFNNYDDFRLTMGNIDEENIYLLVPKYSNPEIMNEISAKIKNGDYYLVLEDSSWIPYLLIKVNNNS